MSLLVAPLWPMALQQHGAVESFVAQWLRAPSKAEVAASHTHHSHARRYRSREAPLKYALHRIADDSAQRPVIQQWLKHIACTCPGSLYLPQFDASDILSVVGCARGAPTDAGVRAAILASALRSGMEDFALHELSWDDFMTMLLCAEPLVLRLVVDARASALLLPATTKKRPRGECGRASSSPAIEQLTSTSTPARQCCWGLTCSSSGFWR